MENEIDTNNLDSMLNQHFAGRVVRKDLTKLVKEGANVPVYVLEYLLGMYCASDDKEIIAELTLILCKAKCWRQCKVVLLCQWRFRDGTSGM